MSEYSSVVVGKPDTFDFKVYIKGPSGIVSSVHDIPLKPKGSDKRVFNMVVEVPRWSNAKLEVSFVCCFDGLNREIELDQTVPFTRMVC